MYYITGFPTFIKRYDIPTKNVTIITNLTNSDKNYYSSPIRFLRATDDNLYWSIRTAPPPNSLPPSHSPLLRLFHSTQIFQVGGSVIASYSRTKMAISKRVFTLRFCTTIWALLWIQVGPSYNQFHFLSDESVMQKMMYCTYVMEISV